MREIATVIYKIRFRIRRTKHMGMTMTQKILAAHAGLDSVEAGQLIDSKLVDANKRRKEKLELVKQVENLKQQLEETRSVPVSEEDADGEDVPAVKTYDVILRVKPEKVGQIHSQVIDGQKCLVIPMDEDEHAAVNGVNTTV